MHYGKAPGLSKEERKQVENVTVSALSTHLTLAFVQRWDIGMKRPPEKPSHSLPGGTWSSRGKGLPSLARASEGSRCPMHPRSKENAV